MKAASHGFQVELIILLCNRFCHAPTFGRDTIWCFSNNTSELKGIAAQNYKDLLQVCNVVVPKISIMVIEGPVIF